MPTDRPLSRPALPAAVSTLVAAVVQGEPVAATVVAAHRYALYLAVRGSVLPVVTSDAVRAADRRPPRRSRRGPVSWGVDAGDEVLVGGGGWRCPGVDVVAARTWRPARVRPRSRSLAVGCAGGRPGEPLAHSAEPSCADASARRVTRAGGSLTASAPLSLAPRRVSEVVARTTTCALTATWRGRRWPGWWGAGRG